MQCQCTKLTSQRLCVVSMQCGYVFLNHSNLTWLIKLFDKWYQLDGWTTTNLFMILANAGEYSLLVMSYKSWLWYVHTIIKWTPYYFTAQKYIPIIMVMFYKLTTLFSQLKLKLILLCNKVLSNYFLRDLK